MVSNKLKLIISLKKEKVKQTREFFSNSRVNLSLNVQSSTAN